MNTKNIAYMAGLMEGEGSFMTPAPSDPNRSRVSIATTDRDVAERAAEFFGVSHIHHRTNDSEKRWKDSYQVQCRGARAVGVMQTLYTFMGERRREQIRNAISEFVPPVDHSNDICKAGGCEGDVRARGWCHKHYMRWYRNK